MKKISRRSFLKGIAFSAGAFALSSCDSTVNDILNFATGSVGGTDNTVIEAISSVVNANTDLTTSTVTTSGGTEIIYLLESGDVQAGFAGTIDLVNALSGSASFEHAIEPEHMLQCFGFASWALPFVVLENSDIYTYEDLVGKTVGLAPLGSSSAAVLELVLEQYGIIDDVNLEYFTWSEGYTALKDGRVDTFIGSWTSGSPISGLIELKATHGIRLLDLDPDVAALVSEANAGIGSSYMTSEYDDSIAAGEQILAPINGGVIIADASVSEDAMYVYTKTVIERIEDLKALSSYFDAFNDVCMSVCVETVPFHPGAARALEEAGLWEDRFTVYDA